MIKRIWHGYTTGENSKPYENLLKEKIFNDIHNKRIPGYNGIELLKRKLDNDEYEFITIMNFETRHAVKDFMGDNDETAYVPTEAQKLLKKYDKTAQHYEVSHQEKYKKGR